MSNPLTIDVCFDIVCPWCFIGKRNLERALAQWRAEHPEAPVATLWHSYQLVPGVPEGGVPFVEFYARRMGGVERAKQRRAQVLEAASRSGLTLAYEKIAMFPNTSRAHRLLAHARQHAPERVEALVERLFAAYFLNGEDIADRQVLLAMGEASGLDRAQLAPAIESNEMPPDSVLPETVPSGVPFYIFDRRLAVSGAQLPEVLVGALGEAARTATAPAATNA